jgi:hypothetical protein
VTAREEEHVPPAARVSPCPACASRAGTWPVPCACSTVSSTTARRYYDEDERGGFALICTAKARSDRRLRTHQTAAMRRHRYVHGLPAPRGT